MLEKLGTQAYAAVSKPDVTVLENLQSLLSLKNDIIYYEIGVGIGATTLEVAKLMNNMGKIILFSFEKDVVALKHDLNALGYNNIISAWGNERKTYSGYHFELATGFCSGELPLFDIAYIDGGHVFHLDAPAACVLKELCRPGGIMVFDDWTWCMAKSPTMNPSVNPKVTLDYDDKQINTCHVQLVCKVIMDTDARFVSLGLQKDSVAYRRIY